MTEYQREDDLLADLLDLPEQPDSAGSMPVISRSAEQALDTTPARDPFPKMAQLNDQPPRLTATPERIHAADVLGAWSLPDRGTPLKARIEDRQDQLLKYYRPIQDMALCSCIQQWQV